MKNDLSDKSYDNDWCILHDCKKVLHGKKRQQWECLKCRSEYVRKYDRTHAKICTECGQKKRYQRFRSNTICNDCLRPKVKCQQCGRINKEFYCKRCWQNKELRCPKCKRKFPKVFFDTIPGMCICCAYVTTKNARLVEKFALREGCVGNT